MTLNRIFRDLGILAILCLAFYAMAAAVNQLKDGGEDQIFSRARLQADKHFIEKEWLSAIEYYRLLVQEDPYNSLAWHNIAYSYLMLRLGMDEQIKEARDRGASEEQLASLAEQAVSFEDGAIEGYSRSKEFLRYRRRSLLNLAMVYVFRSQWDLAMDQLDAYLEEGSFTNQGLDFIRQFGTGGPRMVGADLDEEERSKVRLHQFARFWELVDRENDSRDKSFRPRPMF